MSNATQSNTTAPAEAIALEVEVPENLYLLLLDKVSANGDLNCHFVQAIAAHLMNLSSTSDSERQELSKVYLQAIFRTPINEF